MRVSDIRVDNFYYYSGKIVKVVKRIKGRWKTRKSIWIDTEARTQKTFLLDTGEIVFARYLEKVRSEA